MEQHTDPATVFPAEVAALVATGVVPTWYAGPRYSGNGTAEALKHLASVRAGAASGKAVPNDDSEDAAAF